MFKIYAEPESPNEGACLRSMMNPNRQTREKCLTYMMNRNRYCKWHVSLITYMMNRNRQMMWRESPDEGGGFKMSCETEWLNEGGGV